MRQRSAPMSKRRIALAFTVSCAALLIAYELFVGDVLFSTLDEGLRSLVDMTVTRLLGAAVFTVILTYLGYKVFNPIKRPFFKGVAFCLPAYVVAINNFPFSSVIKGDATVDATVGKVLLLLVEPCHKRQKRNSNY